MYTVIVKQLLEMQMFRFFECVGVITTAVFISMAVGFFAQDRGIDISFIEAAIAQEDANFKPPYDGGTKVHPDELACMARNIYFEANNQSKAGQIAVARVVIRTHDKPVRTCRTHGEQITGGDSKRAIFT